MAIRFELCENTLITESDIDRLIAERKGEMAAWRDGVCAEDASGVAWKNPDLLSAPALDAIKREAARIRGLADTLVFIAIGGARLPGASIVQALCDKSGRGLDIVNFGNSLSERYLENRLAELDGRSVAVYLCCKNFKTLEPGVHFRIIRRYMQQRYGDEYAERIIVTGGFGEGQLKDYCEACGFSYFEFPDGICVRYSALTAAGLFPMAAAGADIDAVLCGAREQYRLHMASDPLNDAALRYACARQLCERAGLAVELLSYFEPQLAGMVSLWQELLAENEGKSGRGVLPMPCCFPEDLHTVGQFIQQGRRVFFETFINCRDERSSATVHSCGAEDGFEFLDGIPYSELACALYGAVKGAHEKNALCCEITVDGYNERSLGGLLYFIMSAAQYSAKLNGVSPFDQPGVELYKNLLNGALHEL